MVMAMVIAIRIGRIRRLAPTRGASDQRLVDPPPQPGRTEEGLVVEARRQQLRAPAEDRADIEPGRGEDIHAAGAQAIGKRHLGRHQVRHRGRTAADLHQPVGVLHPRRHDAARPVILKAAPDQVNAVGDQCRGQGIARVPLVGPAVEAE